MGRERREQLVAPVRGKGRGRESSLLAGTLTPLVKVLERPLPSSSLVLVMRRSQGRG
jgi:hypothetical protein